MNNQERFRWRKTDPDVDWLNYCPEHGDLFLFYARTYTPGTAFNHSDTNQLISNLKILPSKVRENPNRKYYKVKAIQRFASELIQLLDASSEEDVALVPMPPSKTMTHHEYDDRIDQVAKITAERISHAYHAPLLYRTVDVEGHHTGKIRDPQEIFDHFSINEPFATNLRQNTKWIAILDDVLTSGAHFTAARRKLMTKFPEQSIVGIFWAKAQQPNDFE